MILEEYIQDTLTNIEEIKSLVGESIYPFTTITNPEKSFIRWYIINEEPALHLLNNHSFYKAEVQISVFSNTIKNARYIVNCIERTFNKNNNVLCSQLATIQPIAEDKHTIHYPLRLTFYYNKYE